MLCNNDGYCMLTNQCLPIPHGDYIVRVFHLPLLFYICSISNNVFNVNIGLSSTNFSVLVCTHVFFETS